jgi:glutathione S-transferase
MKFYNSSFSPNAIRVQAVANELGIELDVIDVDIMKGETKTQAYLALNPNGKVPLLTDGDFALWESRAINGYLASFKPEHGLYPDDVKKRAIIDQWSYWQAIHLGPAMQKVSFERLIKSKFGMGEPDESAIVAQVKDVAQFLPVLDANLVGKDWVAGDLSIADFALASTFMFRSAAGISLDEVPQVSGWIERMEQRPSWQSAIGPVMAMMKD